MLPLVLHGLREHLPTAVVSNHQQGVGNPGY